MTDLARARHLEWERFMGGLEVVVVDREANVWRYSYHFKHPVAGEDKAERGWFTSREAALASAEAVKKLKWPEPKL